MIPGPRVFATTRAIVATGCYGPGSGFDPRWTLPKGAQEASGVAEVRRAVREQVAAGADWVKVYADYRRAKGEPATPTFSQEELSAIAGRLTQLYQGKAAGQIVDKGAQLSANEAAILAVVRQMMESGDQGTFEEACLEGVRNVLSQPEFAVVQLLVIERAVARVQPVEAGADLAPSSRETALGKRGPEAGCCSAPRAAQRIKGSGKPARRRSQRRCLYFEARQRGECRHTLCTAKRRSDRDQLRAERRTALREYGLGGRQQRAHEDG